MWDEYVPTLESALITNRNYPLSGIYLLLDRNDFVVRRKIKS
jgi:hypothetical protein